MKVIEFAEFGGPDVLKVVQRAEPAPDTSLVRVRIDTRAVNPADLRIRAGAMAAVMPNRPFPVVLGWDFVGTVIEESSGFAAGQRVLGLVPWLADTEGRGSYAEIILADPEWLAPVPDGLDPRIAATLPLNGSTASQLVDALEITTGTTVLIVGASGTVGAFAAQLAVAAGARVFAVAAAGDEGYVASLGVEKVLSAGSGAEIAAELRAAIPEGADAVVDAVPVGPELVGAVRNGGRFVTVLQARAPQPERDIEIVGVRVSPDSSRLAELAGLANRGTLTVRIAQEVPFDQVEDAHRLAGGRAAGRGRILLVG